jgi:hypothetical protein
MTTLLIKEQLQHEINLIPEQQLIELFKVIHFFRLGIESTKPIKSVQQQTAQTTSIRNNPAFGMWRDIEEDSRHYLQQIRQQQWQPR